MEETEKVGKSGHRSHGPTRRDAGPDGRFTATNETTRFWSKVDKTDACWLWTGALTGDGYGRFRITRNGQPTHIRAHRWAWEQAHGPTPLPLDHRCRTRHCVRPDHLEPVSTRENTRRAHNPGQQPEVLLGTPEPRAQSTPRR